MLRFLMNHDWKMVFMFLILLIHAGQGFTQKKIIHPIQVIHPGISMTDSISKELVEVQDAGGQTKAFYMKVESVVCGDAFCKIDTVTISWNALGEFNALKIPAGLELEKAEGKDFTQEDYAKLDRILRLDQSPLADFYKAEMVGTLGSEGVDAVSRATISLDKSTYVAGAVWTCFTLWHWVHGDIRQIIRNITGKGLTLTQLHQYLKAKNIGFAQLGLEQISLRKAYDKQTAQLANRAMINHPELMRAGTPYLLNSPDSIFEHSILELLTQLEPFLSRISCLKIILNYPQALNQAFYDTLIKLRCQSSDYQEIHLLIEILNQKEAVSGAIIQQFMPRLKSPDFLIARRVYWFLENQILDETQQHLLKAFYEKNKDRL